MAIENNKGSFREQNKKETKPLSLGGGEKKRELAGIGPESFPPALDEHFQFEPLKRIAHVYSPTGRHAELQYGVFSVQYDRETNNAVVVGRLLDGKRTIVDHDFGPVIEPFDGDLRHIGDEHVIIQNDEGLKRVTPDGTRPYTLQDDDKFMAEKSTYLGFSWGNTVTGRSIKEFINTDIGEQKNPKLGYIAGFLAKAEKDQILESTQVGDTRAAELPVVETLPSAEQSTQNEQAVAVVGLVKAVASFTPRSEKMPDQATAIDALSIIAAHVIENPEHDGVIHDDITRMLDEAPETMTEETFRIAQGVIADRLDIIDNQLTTDTLTNYLERNKELLIAEQESKETGAVKSTDIFTRGSDRLGFVYNRAVLALEDLNRGTKCAGVVAAVTGIDTAFDLLTNQSPVAASAITGVAGLGATVYEVVKRRDKNIRSKKKEIDEGSQPQEYSVARLEQPYRWVR